MLDVGGCDSDAPPRWQPSVAIFEYEPPPEDQVHPDLIVSYLKVTCTITGHTMNELSLGGHTAPYYYDPSVGEFLLTLERQLACYGALVHVTVRSPRTLTEEEEEESGQAETPYIADFQPKKRELYELVTQTGSTMSRSLEEVQVRKGGVSSSNAEVVDSGKEIDWSALGTVGGAAAGGAIGGPAGAAVGGVVGSELGGMLGGDTGGKTLNQAQTENLRTTDTSVDRRGWT